MANSTYASGTQELFDLWLETYKGTIGRIWETPAVGPSRERTEKMMKGASTYTDFYGAWMNSSIQLQAVFTEAGRRTQSKIASGVVGDLKPDSFKDYYKIWIEVYSDTFNDFLRSDEFTDDLGKLMSQSLEVQQFNRQQLEENYLSPMNMPTKSEIEELQAEVYRLKKAAKEQAKESKRQMAGLVSSSEMDELRQELAKVKATAQDLARQVKKLSAKK